MADNSRIVTDELVAQVAERLAAAGERVSNRAVWSEIGGGSMTTISAALRRWRERQELQPAQHIERAPLPDAVRAALADQGPAGPHPEPPTDPSGPGGKHRQPDDPDGPPGPGRYQSIPVSVEE